MKIQRKDVDDIVVLIPEDRFDILGFLDLEEMLAEVLAEGRNRVVLDLSLVTFANSSSLAVVARFAREAEILGGTLALAAVNRTIEKLLEAMGMRRGLVEVYESTEQAVRAFRTSTDETTA